MAKQPCLAHHLPIDGASSRVGLASAGVVGGRCQNLPPTRMRYDFQSVADREDHDVPFGRMYDDGRPGVGGVESESDKVRI